jgi:predicted DNA-binding transcriptional regulator YafY
MNEKRKPTYPAALNMAKLIYTLATEARSLTLEDILRILDISERTARRYLKAINEFLSNRQGEPLIKVMKTGGVERWRLNESTSMDATPYQLMSLYLGSILMASLDRTVVRDGLLDMFADLEQSIPLAQRALLKNYQQKFYTTGFGSRHYEEVDDHIDVVLRGLLNQYKLELFYRSQKGERQYVVQPYTLVMHRDALYLNAWVDSYGEIRTFRVDNILQAKLTKDYFDYPTDYSPKSFYEKSFGVFKGDEKNKISVIIEFQENLYDYVANRSWIANQEISPVQDGKFQMKVVVSNLFEIFHWVMSIGSEARVIEPGELIDMVRGEAQKVIDCYDRRV